MSGPDHPDIDPVQPGHAGEDFEPSIPRATGHPVPAHDDRAYLAFLREAEPDRAAGFPILSFVFMIAMALVVAGLGLGLLLQDSGLAGPRGTSGADAGDNAVNAGTTGHRSSVPLCDGVSVRQQGQIERALTLMQTTREGVRLVEQLSKHGICIGVEDLAYNSGYASAERSWRGGWGGSAIVIDRDLLSVAEPDVVAALLVHEATHIDRFIRGRACGVFDGCEVLDNGVVVEEEVAAHAAEAQWWISVYGPGGRRVNSGYGYSLDILAAAYLRGDEAFREFVIELRSDPRDGRGV